jgi:hypothetical protein
MAPRPARGIVEHTAPEAEVLDRAVALLRRSREEPHGHRRAQATPFSDAARFGWPS